MSYTSRERVLAAFAHERADKVPCWCGASTEFWNKAKKMLSLEDEDLRLKLGDDFRRVHAEYTGPAFVLPANVTYRTVFGIERHGLGYGHALSNPLADASMNEIENYSWPDPQWINPSCIKQQASQWNGKYAILGGDWAPLWHDVIDLLGMENLYIKMYENPEIVDAVFEKVTNYYFDVNQKIFDASGEFIDIFFIGNDLGGQTGPLLGPELFRRYMLKHFQRLINLGHDYGLKVQLHCCGGIEPLIPILIESELDSLHAIQPDCRGMDLHHLKTTYGNKIVLNGGIDSHHVLINGTPEIVREKTLDVLKIMMPGGGYVAGASHDTILEETPVENVVSMFDAIHEFGVY
jgi:uroporphyrinogen-III decarboxylase